MFGWIHFATSVGGGSADEGDAREERRSRPRPGSSRNRPREAEVGMEDYVQHESARDRRGKRRPSMQLQLTSMIDVIFLLLIYFVVTATFVQDEGVLTTKLPAIGQSSQVSELPTLSSEMVIQLIPDGPSGVQIRVDSQAVASFTELFEVVKGLQDSPQSIGIYAADDPVKIKPEPQVRWEYVVNAMNAAVRAGYSNVQFSPSQG